jgi:hypothetical protein
MKPAAIEGYLTEEATAAMLDVEIATLRSWSARRKGPPRTVVGRNVLYREAALQKWLLSRERDPEAARQISRSGRAVAAA